MSKLIDTLFGCPHRRTTFPMTIKASPHRKAVEITGTYVVCLDCGKEFPYDWHKMKLVSSPKRKAPEIAPPRAA
jgi:hypothetical protein